MAKKKLEDLTNEQLIAEEETLSFQDIEDLEGLSDEDLLAEEALLVSNEPPQATITDTVKAGVAGVVQGATLGFADEISGTIESVISDKPREQAIKESRERFAKFQEESPNAYIAGEILGGLGSTIASGGASAGYRGAAIVGGLSGIGFSNRKGSELLTDAAIGTAFGIGGEKVARGVGRFVQKMFQKSSPSTVKVFKDLGETTRPENVKFESKLIRDAFNGRYGSADDFVISSEYGRRVQQALDETPDFMKDMLKAKKSEIGERIGSVVDDLPVKEVDVADILEEFKKGMKESLQQSGPDVGARKVIQREILDKIDDSVFGALQGKVININKMTPKQVIDFKRSIQDISFSKVTPDGEINLLSQSSRANSLLQKFTNDITERANSLDPLGNLKELNRQYSQLIQAEDLIPKREQASKLLALQDAVRPTKTGGEMRLLDQTLEAIDPDFRAQVIKEVNPRLSAFQLHQAATFQGGAISGAFRARAGSSIGKGFGPLGEIAGGVIGFGEAGIVNAANAIAKARKAFKVPRSTEGVFANRDIIISKISTLSPPMAIVLNDLISDGDVNAVEEFMIEALKNPASQGAFEQGIGFNGKAVTPEEVANIRQQIMGSSLSLSEKIRAINELETNGTIPEPPAPQLPPQPTPLALERKAGQRSMNLVRQVEKEIGE